MVKIIIYKHFYSYLVVVVVVFFFVCVFLGKERMRKIKKKQKTRTGLTIINGLQNTHINSGSKRHRIVQ